MRVRTRQLEKDKLPRKMSIKLSNSNQCKDKNMKSIVTVRKLFSWQNKIWREHSYWGWNWRNWLKDVKTWSQQLRVKLHPLSREKSTAICWFKIEESLITSSLNWENRMSRISIPCSRNWITSWIGLTITSGRSFRVMSSNTCNIGWSSLESCLIKWNKSYSLKEKKWKLRWERNLIILNWSHWRVWIKLWAGELSCIKLLQTFKTPRRGKSVRKLLLLNKSCTSIIGKRRCKRVFIEMTKLRYSGNSALPKNKFISCQVSKWRQVMDWLQLSIAIKALITYTLICITTLVIRMNQMKVVVVTMD